MNSRRIGTWVLFHATYASIYLAIIATLSLPAFASANTAAKVEETIAPRRLQAFWIDRRTILIPRERIRPDGITSCPATATPRYRILRQVFKVVCPCHLRHAETSPAGN